MEFKGTKGKWMIEEGLNNIIAIGEVGYHNTELELTEKIRVCAINQYAKSEEEIVANAHLLAAAPDMLEALQEAFSLLEHHLPQWYLRYHYSKINKAISKALGEK